MLFSLCACFVFLFCGNMFTVGVEFCTSHFTFAAIIVATFVFTFAFAITTLPPFESETVFKEWANSMICKQLFVLFFLVRVSSSALCCCIFSFRLLSFNLNILFFKSNMFFVYPSLFIYSREYFSFKHKISLWFWLLTLFVFPFRSSMVQCAERRSIHIFLFSEKM